MRIERRKKKLYSLRRCYSSGICEQSALYQENRTFEKDADAYERAQQPDWNNHSGKMLKAVFLALSRFLMLRMSDATVIRLRRAGVEAPTQPILPTTISTFFEFDGSKERRKHKVFQLLSNSLFNALRAQSHLSGSFVAIVHRRCKRQTRIMTQCNNGKHQQKYMYIETMTKTTISTTLSSLATTTMTPWQA